MKKQLPTGYWNFSVCQNTIRKNLSIEVWEADRKIDEDFPEDLYIPDEDTIRRIYIIK